MFLERLSAALVTIVCFSTLAVGANNFTQTDATNTEKEIPLAAPFAFAANIISVSPDCNSDKNGYFTIDILNPDSLAYKFEIRNSSNVLVDNGTRNTNPFITNKKLGAGSYTIKITEVSTSLTDTQTKTISEVPAVTLSAVATSPTCSGQSGSIVMTASGSSGYTYYLNKGLPNVISQPNGNFTISQSGNYTATVFDSKGCPGTFPNDLIVKIPELISPTIDKIDSINCPGGKASITLAGLPVDASSYKILLDGVDAGYTLTGTTATIGNVDAGSHILKVTRPTCPSDVWTSSAINIADYQSLSFDWDVNPEDITLNCYGSDTTLIVKVMGGKAGSTVNLSLYDPTISATRTISPSLSVNQDIDIPNLVADVTYILSAQNNNDLTCTPLTRSFSLKRPPVFEIASINTTPVKCFGNSDGTITFNVSGGTSSKQYFVDGNPHTSNVVTDLPSGPHIVFVRDGACSTNDTTVSISQPTQLVASHNIADDVNLNCPGGSNGEIHLTASGGSGSYKYDLISGGNILRSGSSDSAIVIPNLAGGTYDVQVYEAANSSCTADLISNVVITEPDSLSIVSFNLDTIKCDGELANLSVGVTGGGGSGSSYTYKLYNGLNLVEEIPLGKSNEDFSPLAPGAYTLKVWSDITCDSLSVPFTVESRKKLVVTNVVDSIMVNCPGDPLTYTLTVSGEGGYSYSLDNGVSFTPFPENSVVVNSGLKASANGEVNRFLIRDKYECEAQYAVTIYEPTPIQISDFEKTNNTCSNKKLGKITFNLNGGIPGYRIKLLNTITSDSLTRTDSDGLNIAITSIPAGKYTLDIKDKNGCSLDADLGVIEIESPDSFLIEEPVFDPILCYNGTTDVQLSVDGGWSVDKTIRIVGGDVDKTVAPGIVTLKAGTYTLTATNTDKCIAKKKFTIEQPDSLILKNVIGKNVSCNGANDATISFVITGGVENKSYGLEGTGSAETSFTGNSFTIENVDVGEYNLVVADGNLCYSNVVPVTIDEPDSVTFTYKADSVSCHGLSDGVITLTVQGGSGIGYRTFLNGTEATNPIRNLAAGTYEVLVKDSKNCVSKTEVITVGEPGEIIVVSLIVSDSVSCNNVSDGSLTVDVSGGLPYALQYNAIGTTSGGTVVKRGYQDSNVFENLPGGEYVVYATIVKNGTNFCSTPSPRVTIINPDPINVDNTVLTNVSCHNLQDGKAVITAAGGTGGLVYSLIGVSDNQSNNIGVFTNLGHFGEASTTYNYSIVDDNQCTLNKSFTIINPDELTIGYLDHFQVRCNDEKNGWIKVKVEGGNSGYTFKKDIGGSVTQDVETITANTFKLINYDGGNYTPVVIDSKGCSDTLASPVTIINPEQLVINSVDWGEKECYGYMTDTTIIHVAGGTPGYFYSLDKGLTYRSKNDSIFIGEVIGNKYAVAKDSNGCVSAIEDVFLLTEPEKFSVDYEFTGLKCYYDEHGDMKLDIKGGTGPYSFSFNDATFASPLSITKSSNADVTTVKLLDQGIDLFPNITYKFYLKDDKGCHVQNIAGVTEFTEPFADTLFLVPDKVELKNIKPHDLKCQNQQTGVIDFTLTIGDEDYISSMPLGYTFTAYNKTHKYSKSNEPGTMLVNGLLEGDYELSLVDENGCVAATNTTGFKYEPENIYWGIDTASIFAEFDSIKVLVSNIVQPHCDYWFDGSIEVDVQNFRELGVTYMVELYDSLESRWDQEYEEWGDSINADPAYMIDKTDGHELYYANKQKIVEEIGIGLYKITVQDVYSECVAEVIQEITSIKGDSCPPIDYYNAFTPLNGDGQNDEWEIFGSQYQSFTLQIYTAFGELVYSKKGVSDKNGIKWDGLDYKGRPVPVGTYIYLLKKFEGTPQEVTINGNVTILRANGR